MNLKNQVEWALHCCAVMMALPDGATLPAKVLAEFHGVPKEYLSKALQALSQAGIVIGTLGPTGGYRLAKRPEEITFLDIVEAVEGRRSTFQCGEIRANNPCLPKKHRASGPCTVARIMWQADEAWRTSLRGVTLAAMGEQLAQDVPAEILEKSRNWLVSRA
jgi:Rrf2 family protein